MTFKLIIIVQQNNHKGTFELEQVLITYPKPLDDHHNCPQHVDSSMPDKLWYSLLAAQSNNIMMNLIKQPTHNKTILKT